MSERTSLRLSVLDQSPISEGSTGAQALRNTMDLARRTDALGYTATGWPSTMAARCSPARAPRR